MLYGIKSRSFKYYEEERLDYMFNNETKGML